MKPTLAQLLIQFLVFFTQHMRSLLLSPRSYSHPLTQFL